MAQQIVKVQRAAKAPRKQANTKSNTPPLFFVSGWVADGTDANQANISLSENVNLLLLSGTPPFGLTGIHPTSAVLDTTLNLLKVTFSGPVATAGPLIIPQWMTQLRDQTGGWLAPGSVAVGE
jgi:hypothetical protein